MPVMVIENQPELSIDFNTIAGILREAEQPGHAFRFEHETYLVLVNYEAGTPPRTQLLVKDQLYSDAALAAMPGQWWF